MRADVQRGKWPRVVAALLLTVVVAGCGFHLRNYSLDANLESFYVDSASQHFLADELRQGLRLAGATEAATAMEAELVVELMDQRRLRRSVSTTGSARAAEYEIELGVRFRLNNGAGEALTEPQWITRERVFRVDRDNIVGNNEEQVLIEREMRADLVQSVVRTINAVTGSRAG